MAKRIIPGHAGAAGLAVAIIAGDGRNLVDGSTLAVNGSITTRTSGLDGATELVFATNSDYYRCTKGQPSQVSTPSAPGFGYAFVVDWTQDTTYPSDNCMFSAYATNYGNTLWLMTGFAAGDQSNFFNRGRRHVDNRTQSAGPDVFRNGSSTSRRRWGLLQQPDNSMIQRFNGVTYTGMPFSSSASAFSDQSDILIGRKYNDTWGAANLFPRYLIIWDGAGGVLPSQAVLEAIADDPSTLFEDQPSVTATFAITADDWVFAGSGGPAAVASFALTVADAVFAGAAGGVPATALIPNWVNNTGTLFTSGTVDISFHDPATRALLANAPGTSIDGSGRVSVSSTALQAGVPALWVATSPSNPTWFATGSVVPT